MRRAILALWDLPNHTIKWIAEWVSFELVTRLSVVDATSFYTEVRGHTSAKLREFSTVEGYFFIYYSTKSSTRATIPYFHMQTSCQSTHGWYSEIEYMEILAEVVSRPKLWCFQLEVPRATVVPAWYKAASPCYFVQRYCCDAECR